MTRVRTDNVFGTLTDNPLSSGATTMNSAGLANLAAVSSAEAIIILDPNRVAGAPEIVVVTAHTGSATSATIQRGQFGTTARQHNLGTAWVHGPVASNASTYSTAADDQGDYVPPNAWESWTPTFTNFTIGNGTVTGAYVRIGRTIHFKLSVILGSTSSMSTDPKFTLPVTAATYHTHTPIGSANILDASAADFLGTAWCDSTTLGRLITWLANATYVTGAVISSTIPMTWTTSDGFMITGTYEAAT